METVKRLVLAGSEVPAGAYADQVLARAGAAYGKNFSQTVNRHIVSRENHVRQTLQKVVLGEADAAIVYATDAIASKSEIVAIEIPDDINIVASYPIAVVLGEKASAGREFVRFLGSDRSAKILRQYGFSVPAK